MTNRSKQKALALAVLVIFPCASRAVVVDATWIDGNSSWHNPAGWNFGVVPNNGADTYNVSIPTGSLLLQTPAVTIDRLNLGAAATLVANAQLTTTQATTIDGIATFSVGGRLQLGGAGLLSGTGTLHVGSSGAGFGTITTSASAITIDSGMHVALHASVFGEATKPLVNNGYIVGNGVGTQAPARLVGSTLKNSGIMEARGGVLELRGTYSRADLGNLVWGTNGAFEIAGTMQNTAQTFNIASGEIWRFTGEIVGGTMNIAPGANFGIQYPGGATLTNVTVNGKIFHGGGQPLMNSNLVGNSEYVLTNTFLEGPSNIKSLTPMTVGANVLVHGAGGFNLPPNTFGNGSGMDAPQITNHGTIRSDSEWGLGPNVDGELGIYTPTLTNDGTIATLAKSWIYASGNITFAPGGVLDVQMSPTTDLGLLRMVGVLNLATALDSLQLSTSVGVEPHTFYRVVTTGAGVIGQFESVTPGFEVEYRNGTEIWARFVPEPATLGVIGMASLARLARRRRN